MQLAFVFSKYHVIFLNMAWWSSHKHVRPGCWKSRVRSSGLVSSENENWNTAIPYL